MLKRVVPLSLVPVPIFPLVSAKALNMPVDPLAAVAGLFVLALPNSIAVLEPFLPVSLVCFAICPLVDALTFSFVLNVVAQVGGSIIEHLIARAVTLITKPVTLVDPTSGIQ